MSLRQDRTTPCRGPTTRRVALDPRAGDLERVTPTLGDSRRSIRDDVRLSPPPPLERSRERKESGACRGIHRDERRDVSEHRVS